MDRKKLVHKRAESWFDTHPDSERVYSESYTRVSGMDDLTPYIPKPKPKPKPKAKKK